MLMASAVYNNLGYHWATSLLAFLTLAMVPFPYVPVPFILIFYVALVPTLVYDEIGSQCNCRYLFFRYGSRIRKHSRFAHR